MKAPAMSHLTAIVSWQICRMRPGIGLIQVCEFWLMLNCPNKNSSRQLSTRALACAFDIRYNVMIVSTTISHNIALLCIAN